MSAFTKFDYLLNAMEEAAQELFPADCDYAGKREAVKAYVAELEQTIEMLRTGDTCARHCEGTAFRIEARRLKRWSDELRAALSGEHKDAARYRKVRRGQHWSVINGIGDDLRGEALDAAVDAVIAKDAP